MTIDEAIKVLKEHSELVLVAFNPKLRIAIGLGIEALKRVRDERTGYELYAPDLLPGETKE